MGANQVLLTFPLLTQNHSHEDHLGYFKKNLWAFSDDLEWESIVDE